MCILYILQWRRGCDNYWRGNLKKKSRMAAQNIQPMSAFEPRSDPTSTSARWSRWLERFNTYLVAADIKDDGRKRALLLYQAGSEVYEIFKTLEEDEAKDFKSAVKALTKYFEPEKT